MSHENRSLELDALRGLGALIVVLHHLSLLLAFPKYSTGSFITHNTPLRILFSGRAAVLLFFILSGYALAAMSEKDRSYASYLVRRACRIMLPLAAALILSAGLYFILQPIPLPDMSGWVNGMIWNFPVTWEAFFRHLFLLGETQDIFMDGVVWSLVYEMRISLFFPLLYMCCRKIPRLTLLGSVALYTATSLMRLHLKLNYTGSNFAECLILTLNFVPLFMCGAFLFIYRDKIVLYASRLKNSHWFAVYIILFVLLIDKHEPLIALGCVGLLGWAFTSKMATKFLCSPPLLFLGKISYSLYLTHLLVLGTLVQVAHQFGVWPLAFTTFFLAIFFAVLFNRGIEYPSLQLGRLLGRQFSK